MRINFRSYYLSHVVKELNSTGTYSNINQVPKILKICLNRGSGAAIKNDKELASSVKELSLIAGQKPKLNKAKKSIAGFKIRDGWIVGSSVTLRKARMYAFLEKLIHIVLPRIRDFRGVNPQSFDPKGSYSMGISSQTTFPEISDESVDRTRGVDITIVTSARTVEEGRNLLRLFGMPFAT
jgi:large subunit ribosomal protein L5